MRSRSARDVEASQTYLSSVDSDAKFTGGSAAGPRSTGTYLGTEEDLGFTLEIADVPAGFTVPEPDYVYPPECQESA